MVGDLPPDVEVVSKNGKRGSFCFACFGWLLLLNRPKPSPPSPHKLHSQIYSPCWSYGFRRCDPDEIPFNTACRCAIGIWIVSFDGPSRDIRFHIFSQISRIYSLVYNGLTPFHLHPRLVFSAAKIRQSSRKPTLTLATPAQLIRHLWHRFHARKKAYI